MREAAVKKTTGASCEWHLRRHAWTAETLANEDNAGVAGTIPWRALCFATNVHAGATTTCAYVCGHFRKGVYSQHSAAEEDLMRCARNSLTASRQSSSDPYSRTSTPGKLPSIPTMNRDGTSA